ncbi:MAG: hypothetical protein WC581_12775 [Thermodesulfovibrionales bacterium]
MQDQEKHKINLVMLFITFRPKIEARPAIRIALTASRFFMGSVEAVNRKTDQPNDKKEMILSWYP